MIVEMKKTLKKLKGDASLRTFFRNKKKNFSSILIYAKKEKKVNLLNYDSVNKILINNNILAPKLIKENYSKNYIEIQDFGNQTVYNYLKKKKKVQTKIFKKIIKLLCKMQLISQRKIKNFKNKDYIIPTYKSQILLDEAKLFVDWYISSNISKSNQIVFRKKFVKIIKDLIRKLNFKNDIFVHRDFHVSNLMMVKENIGVIDSQDALIGNKAYDLASLIDDVRFKTSENFKKKLLNFYLRSQKRINKEHLKQDFEIISVLRNLKIIGIFTRLAIRDKKTKYLRFIPYGWELIKIRTKNNKKFSDLNELLKIIRKIKFQ